MRIQAAIVEHDVCKEIVEVTSFITKKSTNVCLYSYYYTF